MIYALELWVVNILVSYQQSHSCIICECTQFSCITDVSRIHIFLFYSLLLLPKKNLEQLLPLKQCPHFSGFINHSMVKQYCILSASHVYHSNIASYITHFIWLSLFLKVGEGKTIPFTTVFNFFRFITETISWSIFLKWKSWLKGHCEDSCMEVAKFSPYSHKNWVSVRLFVSKFQPCTCTVAL